MWHVHNLLPRFSEQGKDRRSSSIGEAVNEAPQKTLRQMAVEGDAAELSRVLAAARKANAKNALEVKCYTYSDSTIIESAKY